MDIGNIYPVVVTKILARGIIVQLEGTDSTEFIHISNLSNKFVSDINTILHVGETIRAICIKGKISDKPELSLRHLSKEPISTTTQRNKPKQCATFEDMLAASTKTLTEKLKVTESRTKRRCK